MVKILEATFESLRTAGVPFTLAAGESLWREGDPADSVVLLADGFLDIFREGAPGAGDSSQVLLRTVGPGSLVGDIACLDGLARSASVSARTGCLMVRIPAATFRDLVDAHPDLLQGLLRQQTARVRNLSRLVSRHRQHAITDALTGLYNFGFFQERLELEVSRARETGDPIALALFDLDRFKQYNDTHGHPEGNRVLVRLAALLRACGRRGDVVCRYGGEEFVFLLYGAGREDALALAEGVRRRVEEVFASEGFPSPVTVSGGVALFPDDARDPDALVSAADTRLYAAKRMGRNRIES